MMIRQILVIFTVIYSLNINADKPYELLVELVDSDLKGSLECSGLAIEEEDSLLSLLKNNQNKLITKQTLVNTKN